MKLSMTKLVKYLLDGITNGQRPVVLRCGGIYIWDADQTKILAGPFSSVYHALDFRSRALDKAIAKYNQRPRREYCPKWSPRS